MAPHITISCNLFLAGFEKLANLLCLTDIQCIIMRKIKKSRPGVIYGGFFMAFGGTGVYYDNSLLLDVAILVKNV